MSLLPLFDQLQLQKDDILSELESWPLESIKKKPTFDEWSAIEVIDHLVRTEVEILAAARRGMLKPHRIGFIDAQRTRFLQAIIRSDRKVRVPSTASQILPGSNLELSAIVQRWNESRRELCDLLKTASDVERKQGIFKHPVAGWMGMSQILDFFSVHIVHHRYQLTRLRE